MDKKEFLETFELLLQNIVEVLQWVTNIDSSECISVGFLLETVKQQNEEAFYIAREKSTLYDSSLNASLLRKLTILHPNSTLVKAEANMRNVVQPLFIAEMTELAKAADESGEPELREQFMMFIARITGLYEKEISSGDYMTKPSEWFYRQIEVLHQHTVNPEERCLKRKYFSLRNLIQTTFLLMEFNQRRDSSEGEKFNFAMNDWFNKFGAHVEKEHGISLR